MDDEVQVRSISPFEVKSLVNNKGYLIVDVRKPEDFAMRHARGSVNIPLFRNAKVRFRFQFFYPSLCWGGFLFDATNAAPFAVCICATKKECLDSSLVQGHNINRCSAHGGDSALQGLCVGDCDPPVATTLELISYVDTWDFIFLFAIWSGSSTSWFSRHTVWWCSGTLPDGGRLYPEYHLEHHLTGWL